MYKSLGVISILLLLVLGGLAVVALKGKRTKKEIFVIAGVALTLMSLLTWFCSIIYLEFN